MGAVHGVYLKYFGLSAMSLAGCGTLLYQSDSNRGGDSSAAASSNHYPTEVNRLLSKASSFLTGRPNGRFRSTFLATFSSIMSSLSTPRQVALCTLAYSSLINGGIAVGFLKRKGMNLIGKDIKTGRIPLWSYAIYFPFHLPTVLYTYLHNKIGRYSVTNKDGTKSWCVVPVASEVLPGWWLGGRYSHRLGRRWDGIVDLTVEFPEYALGDKYMCIPLWDGVPPTPAQLEEAANFAADCYCDNDDDNPHGQVLVHCAHGRGRSTTVMCAALVKTQLFPTWQAAFDAIKAGRPVVSLNSKMRDALTQWQATYIDDAVTDKKNE